MTLLVPSEKEYIEKVKKTKKALVARDFGAYVDEYSVQNDISEMISVMRSDDKFISLGYPYLENTFSQRGWPPGSINMFLAKSKVGKTYMATHSSVCVLKEKKKVLFISMEETRYTLGMRFAKRILEVGPIMLWWITRRVDGQQFINDVFRLNGFDNFMGVYDRVNVDDIYVLVQKFKPQLVVIDHLHKMKDVRGATDERERVYNIAIDHSEMAKHTDCVYMDLVQISRGDSGAKSDDGSVCPSISAGRDSSGIEEVAMSVNSLWRPELAPIGKDDAVKIKEKNTIHLRVMGGRFHNSYAERSYKFDSLTGYIVDEFTFEKNNWKIGPNVHTGFHQLSDGSLEWFPSKAKDMVEYLKQLVKRVYADRGLPVPAYNLMEPCGIQLDYEKELMADYLSKKQYYDDMYKSK